MERTTAPCVARASAFLRQRFCRPVAGAWGTGGPCQRAGSIAGARVAGSYCTDGEEASNTDPAAAKNVGWALMVCREGWKRWNRT